MRHAGSLALAAILAVAALLVARNPSSGAGRRSTPVMPSPAVVDTPFVYKPLSPGISYGSFGVAIDTLMAIVRRTYGASADSAHWSQDSIVTVFRDSVALHGGKDVRPFWFPVPSSRQHRVPSFRVVITTQGIPPADVDLGYALHAAGWGYDENSYEQGTDDGNAYAMVCREAYCSMTMTWEMRLINDSTRVRLPGEIITVDCRPRPPEPRDPRIRKH